jgi:hypothetical protein
MTYHFVSSSGGKIPNGATAEGHGHEVDGTPIWVARAMVEGTLQLGKVRPGFGSALIPFGGKEVAVNDYEVLMETGIWESAIRQKRPRNGIPVGAIVYGNDAGDVPLFVARGFPPGGGGGLHPGRMRADFDGAHIGFGGVEKSVEEFAILVVEED